MEALSQAEREWNQRFYEAYMERMRQCVPGFKLTMDELTHLQALGHAIYFASHPEHDRLDRRSGDAEERK